MGAMYPAAASLELIAASMRANSIANSALTCSATSSAVGTVPVATFWTVVAVFTTAATVAGYTGMSAAVQKAVP